MPSFDLAALTAPGRTPRFAARSATGCDEFDYAPGQPNLFMLMNLKHFLVEEHGLEAGFDLYRRVITTAGEASLRPLKLESHHAFCSARARVFHEIFPAGEPIALPPPRVIGLGNHRTLVNTTRSFYVACVDDALVRGRSSIVEVDGLALADFQGDELSRIDDEFELDSAIFHRDGDRIWAIADDRPARRLEAAFTLLGCHTDFFGNWLCESIQKYVGATLRGNLPPVPILIDESMPKTHREALDLSLPRDVEVIEIPAFEAVRVERLWSAPGINYMAFHQKQNERFKWDYFLGSAERAGAVCEEMGRRADRFLGEKETPARVFLARKDFRHRKLVNRVEIEAIAAEAGFAIVYPEDHAFVDQVALLRNARYVVAPEGSALALGVYLKGGVKECILNHQQTEGVVLYNADCDPEVFELTVITGPKAGEQRGSPQDVDYWIDPEVFRRFLAEWFPDLKWR